MSVSGSRNRASIQSLISNATRPALSARSRCRAVILLSARKLTASSGISSTSGAPRKPGDTSSASASCRSVSADGSWWPFSYREMLRVLRPVSPASWVRVRPRRLRAITSRDGVRAAAGPPGIRAG